MENSTKLYSLPVNRWDTYAVAAAFTLGAILLPQLCHTIPGGGLRWLPIYFFTLVVAYKYGVVPALVTALAAPLLNSALFDMPSEAMLPVIILKGSVLAVLAAMIAKAVGRVTLWAILLAVVGYQLIGGLGEWAVTGSWHMALTDWVIGWPGMLLQWIAGWALLRYVFRSI
ncbi:MAG: ECF transporter S component [Bacteroidales bacterium]|nr:ECF transporter S component [Bacteroidales bacterium]